MPTKKKNLSDYSPKKIPNAKKMRFGIIVSEWNNEITGALLEGTIKTLRKHKCEEKNIAVSWVPGSFELPLAAQYSAKEKKFDAIICLGCVIQGETRHFDFISDAVANGIMNVGLNHNIPVVFGVLTTDNIEQAIARSGGKHGNKGTEAAITAISMVSFRNSLKK